MNLEQKKELYGAKKNVPLYYNFLKSKDLDDLTYVKLAHNEFYMAVLSVNNCIKPVSKICLPIKDSE